jgi:hypothetical protein
MAHRGLVAVFQLAESDCPPWGVRKCRPDVRRTAVVLDEGHDVKAFGQDDQLLLKPHEQVGDLLGFVLGFVPCDLAEGEAVQFAVVAELNAVAPVALLQRRHDLGPPQHHRNVRQTTLPNLCQGVSYSHPSRTDFSS